MGQSVSSSSSQPSSFPLPAPPSPARGSSVRAEAVDHTEELPDELLALVFGLLGSGDRSRCSLVCRRWLAIEGSSRSRLALDARAAALLPTAAPRLAARFPAVARLSLRCDRRSESIGDDALAAVAGSLGGPFLRRLKFRSLRAASASGLASAAALCTSLRKLSVASCCFGPSALADVVAACHFLEEISLKRLSFGSESNSHIFTSLSNVSSLRTISLKELYNGQCLALLIASAPQLRSLKLIRCSGDWDPVLESLRRPPAGSTTALAELHLQMIQVSDRGLAALGGLEVIHLVKTPECTDSGLAALVGRSPGLRKLHVDSWRSNQIGDRALTVVADKCRALQELILVGINLTAATFELIAANCPALERLALCGSDTFGDAEVACLAGKCAALRKLCIKACPVSDIGMAALVAGCPQLVKVKVKKCSGVTFRCADLLRATRGSSLTVNFDVLLAARADDPDDTAGIAGTVVGERLSDVDAADMPRGGTARRPAAWKARLSRLMSSRRGTTSGAAAADNGRHHGQRC